MATLQLKEALNLLSLSAIKTFENIDPENQLNDARKTAEHFCTCLLQHKYGDANAQKLILGQVNYKLSANSKPKRLPLASLIIEVTRQSDTSYTSIISDANQREKIRAYLEAIRINGNSASHASKNFSPTEFEKMDLKVTIEALKSLLQWCYTDFFKIQPSHLLRQFLVLEHDFDLKKEVNSLLELKNNLLEWFKILKYESADLQYEEESKFIFKIKIQERRSCLDILVVGQTTEIKQYDHNYAQNLLSLHKSDEVWIITNKTISNLVKDTVSKKSHPTIFCYTFDDLIEQHVNLSNYFNWIKDEVRNKGIEKKYVHIGCERYEIDKITKRTLGRNKYEDKDGNTEGYLDRWLTDDSKEHVSILGEFGTGKTWLTLHYTAKIINDYETAKKRNLPRPRIPILIHLRDFAKAVNVDVLISDFFFRKHQIEVTGAFTAFQFLNKLGKILLIFDGFDEMAEKVNKQKMINNFWELATVVTGNSKVILTCRTEHFPQITEGRSLLNAELKNSTKHLTGNSPQFEVIGLNKLNKKQILQILLHYTNEKIVKRIASQEKLMELLTRPIMTELIIESLQDLEHQKSINIAKVYLYATKRKMERDIGQNRTFTSLADKLFFLCEISWQMISTDKLKIHFQDFIAVTSSLFQNRVEDNEIDYWRYDMRGQTMMNIDEEDGYYKPAHKSFLEFFVAYKFACELGVISEEFLSVAEEQSYINLNVKAKPNTWRDYFTRSIDKNGEINKIPPLLSFTTEEISLLKDSYGRAPLTKAILDFLVGMIDLNDSKVTEVLLNIINICRHKKFSEVGYIPSNIVTMICYFDANFFAGRDLSNLCLQKMKMPQDRWDSSTEYRSNGGSFNFENSDLTSSDLKESDFSQPRYSSTYSSLKNSNLNFTNLENVIFPIKQIDNLAINSAENLIAIGSPHEFLLLDPKTYSMKESGDDGCWHVAFSQKDDLAHSGWAEFTLIKKSTEKK